MSAKKPARGHSCSGRQDKTGFDYRSFLKTRADGPIALVHDRDMIEVDVKTRTSRLCVADADLERRRAAWTPPAPASDWGYTKMYIDHVLQADRGSGLDFLVGKSGAPVPRDNH